MNLNTTHSRILAYGLLGLVAFSTHATERIDIDDIRLGEASMRGSGCPLGSADVVLSPDSQELSILFSDYYVEAEPNDKGRRASSARGSCNIAVPISLPQGLSVSLLEIDYRGFINLPKKSSARFRADYFFAGDEGPVMQKEFKGPDFDDFLVDNDLNLAAIVWSECGAEVNLRANTSLSIRNSNKFEYADAGIDTTDIKAGIIYHLRFRQCD